MEREKVIKKLGVVRNAIVDGYIHDPDRAVNAITDAIALLKENEPVQPLYTTTSHPFHVGILYHCGNCHCLLDRDKDLFCSRCGKPIDWEKGAVKWE